MMVATDWARYWKPWASMQASSRPHSLPPKTLFRVVTAQRQAQMATKESRKRRRLRRLGRGEEKAEAEGFPYLAGGH